MTFKRFPITFLFTAFTVLFMTVFLGILFFKVGDKPTSQPGVLAGILGAIIQTMIFGMMMLASMVIGPAVNERPLYVKEYATYHYAALPFRASKFIFESLESAVIILLMVRNTLGLVFCGKAEVFCWVSTFLNCVFIYVYSLSFFSSCPILDILEPTLAQTFYSH